MISSKTPQSCTQNTFLNITTIITLGNDRLSRERHIMVGFHICCSISGNDSCSPILARAATGANPWEEKTDTLCEPLLRSPPGTVPLDVDALNPSARTYGGYCCIDSLFRNRNRCIVYVTRFQRDIQIVVVISALHWLWHSPHFMAVLWNQICCDMVPAVL